MVFIRTLNQNRVTVTITTTATASHLKFFMANCKIFYTVILSILLSAPSFFNIVKNVKSQKTSEKKDKTNIWISTTCKHIKYIPKRAFIDFKCWLNVRIDVPFFSVSEWPLPYTDGFAKVDIIDSQSKRVDWLSANNFNEFYNMKLNLRAIRCQILFYFLIKKGAKCKWMRGNLFIRQMYKKTNSR